MSEVEHLIENAIYAIANNREFNTDSNADYTSCTVLEAREMAQHIVYSLYDGILPTDDFSKVVRCSKCAHYDKENGYCRNGTYVTGNPNVDYCSQGKEEEVKSKYTD